MFKAANITLSKGKGGKEGGSNQLHAHKLLIACYSLGKTPVYAIVCNIGKVDAYVFACRAML